jgi:hypothetical protein
VTFSSDRIVVFKNDGLAILHDAEVGTQCAVSDDQLSRYDVGLLELDFRNS